MVDGPESAAAEPSSGAQTALGRATASSDHPTARLTPELQAELIDWARAGRPNEACGILAGDRPAFDGGRPLRFHPLTNAEASPYLYRIEPREQLRTMLAIDDADEVIWGIFHSHVASAAAPSVTDIGLAFYPEALYLICSLANPTAPQVRAWSIRDGVPVEVPLVVE